MKKRNHEHRWTNQELMKLIALWHDKKNSVDDIALEFGCTPRGINKQVLRMRKEGIPLPYRKAGHKKGRHNKPWAQSEVEFLIRRRNEQATADEIALELGRSFYAVQGMIYKLRQEGVQVLMLGHGVRRKWCPEKLKAAVAGRELVPLELQNA